MIVEEGELKGENPRDVAEVVNLKLATLPPEPEPEIYSITAYREMLGKVPLMMLKWEIKRREREEDPDRPVNKYAVIAKIEAEQRAIRQARNNLGGKDGK